MFTSHSTEWGWELKLGLTPKLTLLIISYIASHSGHGANSMWEVVFFIAELSELAHALDRCRHWRDEEATWAVKSGSVTGTNTVFRILLVYVVPLNKWEKSAFSGQMNYKSHSEEDTAQMQSLEHWNEKHRAPSSGWRNEYRVESQHIQSFGWCLRAVRTLYNAEWPVSWQEGKPQSWGTWEQVKGDCTDS